MSRTEAKTTIRDDYGVEHGYFTIQHGGVDALNLLRDLIRIAGPPAAYLLAGLAQAGVLQRLDLEALRNDAIFGLPENINLEKLDLGLSFSALTSAIMEHGTPEFFHRILSKTTRQADPADGTNYRKLDDFHNFDSAYQGNLGELFSALWWVLQVNFAPLLRARLARLGLEPGALVRKIKTAWNESKKASTATGGSAPSSIPATPH